MAIKRLKGGFLIMDGLFKQVEDKLDDSMKLEKKTYNKSSMVAISHAIEEIVLKYKISANLYVTFQKEEFFLIEKEKYKKLDKLCNSISLFADEFSKKSKEGFSETTNFYNLNDFSNDLVSSLKTEWTVIVQHPLYSMALLTKEVPESQEIEKDAFRRFKGNFTFDKDTVNNTIDILNYMLEKEDINLPKYDSEKISSSNEIADKQSEIILPFLNNALKEIEEKVNALANQNIMLDYSLQENKRRTKETIKRLGFAAEYKDTDTAVHLVRIGLISTLLYSRVEKDESLLENMFYGSLMHDIGKIGIEDDILFKPGKLNSEEYETIKKHTEIGYNILSKSEYELIQLAQEIAYTHHERWDGGGYPRGLSGKDIPLVGRVVAIVDVFDALLSDRVYKEAFSLEKTIKILTEERNAQFDGELLDIFLANLDTIMDFRQEVEANFSDLNEKQVASKYFDLQPDFSKLTGDKIPGYQELFG